MALTNCLGASSYPASSLYLLHSVPGFSDSLLSLVETALVSLEGRYLLVVKGAKDYFFLSTIVALVKARLWPAQAFMYKQQVVERVLSFAQTMFTRHATCEHLGNWGMGNFKNDQVRKIPRASPARMQLIVVFRCRRSSPPPESPPCCPLILTGSFRVRLLA